MVSSVTNTSHHREQARRTVHAQDAVPPVAPSRDTLERQALIAVHPGRRVAQVCRRSIQESDEAVGRCIGATSGVGRTEVRSEGAGGGRRSVGAGPAMERCRRPGLTKEVRALCSARQGERGRGQLGRGWLRRLTRKGKVGDARIRRAIAGSSAGTSCPLRRHR